MYYRCGRVTEIWQLQLFYEKNYQNLNFIRIWPEKPIFWGVVLVQVQWFRIGTRYELEILHCCCKRVKTKSQKILRGKSYVFIFVFILFGCSLALREHKLHVYVENKRKIINSKKVSHFWWYWSQFHSVGDKYELL